MKSDHHFIEKYAECPPVYSFCVSLTFQEFWRNVFGCPTKGISFLRLRHVQFAKSYKQGKGRPELVKVVYPTEITKCNMTGIIK